MFQIGENVVNVKGPSTAGDFDLQAQRGRWVVLYFYQGQHVGLYD